MKTTDRNRFFASEKLSENIYLTPEGYLLCKNVSLARDGVLLYHKSELPMDEKGDEKGMVKVFRDPSEIFNKKTLSSFEGKPVTIGHPPEFITPENWNIYAVGTCLNVSKGDDHRMKADLLITNPQAIEKIKSKKIREISCGYDADYSEEKGKVVQKNILGNHVALVLDGRCGSSCRIQDKKFVTEDEEEIVEEKLEEILEKLNLIVSMLGNEVIDEDSEDECSEDEDFEDEDIEDEDIEDEDIEDEESSEDEDFEDEDSEDECSEDEDFEDEDIEDEETDEEFSDVESSEDEESVTDKCRDARYLPRSVISSIEVLAPGLLASTKDANTCLNASIISAIKDADTKAFMKSLRSQSKKPLTSLNTFERGMIVDSAAKIKRAAIKKAHVFDSSVINKSSGIDAKAINKINEKFYK